MKVVYIAGPYRAKTAWEIEQNVRRAEEAALEVAKLGAMPLCPHTNTRFFHGLLTDEFWLNGTAELLRRSDAVYLLPGWVNSEGSVGESNLAHKLKMPIFNSLVGLADWIKS